MLLLSLLGIAWFCGFRIRKKKRSRWLVDERPGKPFFFFVCVLAATQTPVTRRKKNPIMKRKKKKNLGCTFFFLSFGYIPVDIYPTYFITNNLKNK